MGSGSFVFGLFWGKEGENGIGGDARRSRGRYEVF